MHGPDGNEFPHRGVYLEVIANERLVFTDAYTTAWELSSKPFMTVILSFEDAGGKTRYTARARHWTEADRETHEKMGFHEGWGRCTDQLAALVMKLRYAFRGRYAACCGMIRMSRVDMAKQSSGHGVSPSAHGVSRRS